LAAYIPKYKTLFCFRLREENCVEAWLVNVKLVPGIENCMQDNALGVRSNPAAWKIPLSVCIDRRLVTILLVLTVSVKICKTDIEL
jgi:hypothetical protein